MAAVSGRPLTGERTYKIEGLSSMAQEMVRLELADSNTMAVLTIPEHESYKYVVMPMRI